MAAIGEALVRENAGCCDQFHEIHRPSGICGHGWTQGRSIFVSAVKEYGYILFLGGIVVTLVPLITGLFFGHYLLKLNRCCCLADSLVLRQ